MSYSQSSTNLANQRKGGHYIPDISLLEGLIDQMADSPNPPRICLGGERRGAEMDGISSILATDSERPTLFDVFQFHSTGSSASVSGNLDGGCINATYAAELALSLVADLEAPPRKPCFIDLRF